MNEETCFGINYFVTGTQFNKVKEEKPVEENKIAIEKKIDDNLKFRDEIYQRDNSYSKIIGHVEEQD